MARHNFANRRRRIGQPAAHQRLHHHHCQPLFRGQPEPARARLVLGIHVVVLDLAEGPQVARVHDLFKALVVVVERKAQMPDASVGQRALCFAEQVVLQNNVGPPGLVQ